MKKKIYFILFFLALQPLAHGQMIDSISKGPRHMSLQVLTGTQGIGINFRYLQDESVGFRVGGSYASARFNNKINMDGFNAKNRGSGKFNTVQLLVEFTPQKSFHLVAGAAYLAQAEAIINFEPKDPQGLIPEENLDFKMDWGGYVAPYFGVVFGRGIPKNKFNVNIDLGGYYLHSPTVKAIGTNVLNDNDPNAAIIQNNLKHYRLMPVVQLNFNFKFN